MKELVILARYPKPALVAAAGERTAYRFLEFLTAQIRNPNTHRAYTKAVGDFCASLIAALNSIHVAAYVEEPGRSRSAPTGKQRLEHRTFSVRTHNQ